MGDSNDIDYEGEYDELVRLQAQAAQDIGPIIEAQVIPKKFTYLIVLDARGLDKEGIEALAEQVKLAVNETLAGEYKNHDYHAGQLSIYCIAANADELTESLYQDNIMSRLLSLTWVDTETNASKKVWRL